LIYAIFGDAEKAIDILDHRLDTPYEFPIAVGRLRLNPRFDPLRDQPRFQALLEKCGKEE
jgi:hypothetical protein